VKRRVKGDMDRFKDFLEARGGNETGGWRGKVNSVDVRRDRDPPT
jgi:hypothetical protein